MTCIYGSYRDCELWSGTEDADQTIPSFASHKIQLSPAAPSMARRIGVGMSCISVGLKKKRGRLLQGYDGHGVNTQSLVSEPPRVFLFLTIQINMHLCNTSQGWENGAKSVFHHLTTPTDSTPQRNETQRPHRPTLISREPTCRP